VVVPATVAAVAGADRVTPVWRNQLGGLTFEFVGSVGRRFLKWAPVGSGLDVVAEAERLRWAGRFVSVPRVLDAGSDETGAWLITAALAGENAVSPRWLGEPVVAATAIGRGLRALHDQLPVRDCPFTWSVQDRLTYREFAAGRASDQGDQAWRHPEHAKLSAAEIDARLRDPPSVDRLVVCHGDACAPNTLIGTDGNFSGHVDLGALGLADPWADLAVATWSLDWNYGPGYQLTLLQAYGIDPDPDRIAFYRLLWDMTP
jgi:kanamycin kinase